MRMKSEALGMRGVLLLFAIAAEVVPLQAGDIRGKFDFAKVGPSEYWPMRQELRAFFPTHSTGWEEMDPAVVRHWQDVWRELQGWAKAHPGADALDIRCESYRIMGRTFLPILFRESPFYCEACVGGGYYGLDTIDALSPFRRPIPIPGYATFRLCRRFLTEKGWIPKEDLKVLEERHQQLYSYICGPFVDEYHTAPPIRKILEGGFKGVKDRVLRALADCPPDDPEGRRYLEAMALGLDTVHAIQLKYREEALRRIAAGATGEELRRLERIAESAARCPWEPPRTFFEGLNTLGFCREIFAYVEGLLNNCSHGRLDAWLIGLYRADLAAGRITEAEARDLVRRFMVLCDCREDAFTEADAGLQHETDAPLTLGGCDDAGRPVWNELTRMVLEEHQRMGVISPKLHVRFSSESPKEYLELLAKAVIEGHCVFAMFNDYAHIPDFVRHGYPLERARDYEGVGCWEGYVTGDTDVNDVNYTSVVRPFVASIYPDPAAERRARVWIEPIDGCRDMEDLKRVSFGNYIRFLRDLTSDYTRYGRHFAKVSPRPLFSACLNGCIERRRDEFDLGLDRHQRTITIGFLSNVVDSMLAIEKVVFEDRFATMDEFLAAVRTNWQGGRNQAIRNEALKAPYWGDNTPKSNALMKWWIDSIAGDLEGRRTDQGGEYRLSCMIYREYMSWGARTPATPDGRYSGDRLAQGFAPSDFRCRTGLADVFHAIGYLDHAKLCASNANLTFGGEDFTPETLAAVFRVFAEKGAHLLQPNCNTVEVLLDAQKHPERHLDLMVKVCGFSTRFVTLSPRFQKEIIERHRLK